MLCPDCNLTHPDNFNYCPQCGQPLKLDNNAQVNINLFPADIDTMILKIQIEKLMAIMTAICENIDFCPILDGELIWTCPDKSQKNPAFCPGCRSEYFVKYADEVMPDREFTLKRVK